MGECFFLCFFQAAADEVEGEPANEVEGEPEELDPATLNTNVKLINGWRVSWRKCAPEKESAEQAFVKLDRKRSKCVDMQPPMGIDVGSRHRNLADVAAKADEKKNRQRKKAEFKARAGIDKWA